MFQPIRNHFAGLIATLGCIGAACTVQAADRADVITFLEVTGFDVALESIALGAEDAPAMLGLEEDVFGQSWKRLAHEVFDVEDMKTQAIDILEATLEQRLLDHAVAFYGSDLGQRLVQTENLSHMDDDSLKQIAGRQLVDLYEASDDPRPAYFARMSDAIDPENIGLRAVQTIQVRFILAASRSGVIPQDIDEEMLWAQIRGNEAEVLAAIKDSAVAASAYTYQGFSPAEIETYVEALETHEMQLVYELMNAVHYQVMGDRFDALALRLDELEPSQDL